MAIIIETANWFGESCPRVFKTNGATVGACVDDLIARFPKAADKILSGSEKRIRRELLVFINYGESLQRGSELEAAVRDGDTISIVYAVA